uniref:Uncharacterized protein n=1 Tax=Globisporangium ultimum (strain ATCC 200006 / CBS 805.95 / DAOM BR144) TaxID=431595 RepID=K3WFU0_GLOUD
MKSALAGPTRRASRSDTILLRIACQHGDLVKLRELLKRGVPVDTLLDDGATPLLVATQRGRDDIVAELLGWRADTFFRRETDLVTPLIAAFNNANANVVALILDHRAKLQPNVQVEVGLYFVEKEETTTVIAEVIDRCARDKDDNRRATPLCIALAKDHLQVLNVLLDRQNAVQWAPLASEVALFIAAQAGHTECVVKLLQCGTRTTLRSEAGVTPLLAALIHGNADIVAVLLDRQGSRGDGGDDSWVLEIELFFQTFGMPAQIVAKICERGEHLGKEVCPELEVPLGEAHLDALEVLLDQEVSVQWSESSRDVGLFFASQFGNEGLVHKLIDQGATLRTKDTGDAVNPFVVACAKGHEDVVAAFLSRGLVTTQAALEWPLCVAAGNGHVEIVRMLLDRGADSSAKSDNDMTPLKASSMNDHIDVVTLLLDRGAVVDWQGESWESILYIAAQAGHTRVVAEFLDRGGPVDFQGDSDATLLHTAALSGRCEISEAHSSISQTFREE